MVTSVQPGWLADGSLPAQREINMALRGKEPDGRPECQLCRVLSKRRNRARNPRPGRACVVVGGGFGGLSAVAVLARSGARVTLVDRNAYSTFQPLLYQVATAGLTPSDIAYPLRAVTRRKGARFRRGVLAGIDLADRQITLTDGGSLGYDYLILATGVAASFFGITGAAEHCLSLYTRTDAIALRDQLIGELERLSIPGQAGRAGHYDRRRRGLPASSWPARWLTCAISRSPPPFPDVDPGGMQIRLIEQATVADHAVHSGAAPTMPYRQLRGRGVEVRLGTGIAAVSAHSCPPRRRHGAAQ